MRKVVKLPPQDLIELTPAQKYAVLTQEVEVILEDRQALGNEIDELLAQHAKDDEELLSQFAQIESERSEQLASTDKLHYYHDYVMDLDDEYSTHTEQLMTPRKHAVADEELRDRLAETEKLRDQP